MSKNELMNSVSRSFHKVGFQLKKHSPEILVVTGVVGTVVSAVMACKATTKLEEVMKKTKDDLEAVKEMATYVEENPESEMAEKYTVEDAKKDTLIVCAKGGVELLKLYGPALAVGTLSITAILAGHNITRKRNVALAAAYATIDKGFKEYRSRVIERFGKELDHELRYNIKAKEVEETIVNEDGSETKVKKTINVVDDPNLYGSYSKFFDEGCAGWEDDAEHNRYFLIQQMNFANEKLKAKGYLFLNEVYDMLGIPKTKAGQTVGWIYDEKNPIGDNYVDFGIFDVHKEKVRDFVNGYEKVILLDFNVDGDIVNRLQWEK